MQISFKKTTLVSSSDTTKNKKEKTMKAAQHTSYNKKNITLNITEIAKPSITDKEVLVKVAAAGVNPLDNMISRGEVKMIVPYKLPQTAGNEVVGIIEETGRQVKNLKVGDRVFGRFHLIILVLLPSM